MKNKPQYSIQSVDNALLLLHLLRDQGKISVAEAADYLGVARSTAHRLLSMLVYRDFAVQDQSNKYRAGSSLFISSVKNRPTHELVKRMLPFMEELREKNDESVMLSIRNGRWVRFIYTIESSQHLRVGDRRGTILPARAASGGRALLAELSDIQLRELYRSPVRSNGTRDTETSLDDSEWRTLLSAVKFTRRTGFALNLPNTEQGVRAVSVALRNNTGAAVGALSVAAPAVRLGPEAIHKAAEALRKTVDDACFDLAGYRDIEGFEKTEFPSWTNP